MPMTNRGKFEYLENEVIRLRLENDRLQRKYELLFEKVSRLSNELSAPHTCGCRAQPSNTSTPKKDIKVRIPHDYICD